VQNIVIILNSELSDIQCKTSSHDYFKKWNLWQSIQISSLDYFHQ